MLSALEIIDRGDFDRGLLRLSSEQHAHLIDAPRADTIRASVARQQGRHSAAEPLDRAALTAAARLPESLDRELLIALATFGLAADRLGQTDFGAAQEHLREGRLAAAAWAATGRADPDRFGLDPICLQYWVETEVHLGLDQPLAAVASGRAAVDRARGMSAHAARRVQHIAKSELFAGVACRVAGQPAAAVQHINACHRAALPADLQPLIGPADQEARLLGLKESVQLPMGQS